jgi:hypothetical protein
MRKGVKNNDGHYLLKYDKTKRQFILYKILATNSDLNKYLDDNFIKFLYEKTNNSDNIQKAEEERKRIENEINKIM